MAPDRRLVLLLAARADCNVKTARRPLVDGVDTIKGANLRDRLREGIGALMLPAQQCVTEVEGDGTTGSNGPPT